MPIKETHERRVKSYSYLNEDGSNPMEGKHVSISAKSTESDSKYEEKKQVHNSGHFTLAFPDDEHGAFHVKVRGAEGGEDEQNLTY